MTNKQLRFDVRSKTGVDFSDLAMAELKVLVGDGTLQLDDLAKITGDPSQQWFPLSQIKGLEDITLRGEQWSGTSADISEKSSSTSSLIWLLSGLFGAFVLLAIVVTTMVFLRMSSVADPPEDGLQDIVSESNVVMDDDFSDFESSSPSDQIYQQTVSQVTSIKQLLTPGNAASALLQVEELRAKLDTKRGALTSSQLATVDQALTDLDFDIQALLAAQSDPESETQPDATVPLAVWFENHHRSVPIVTQVLSDGTIFPGCCSAFLVEYANELWLVTNRHCIDSYEQETLPDKVLFWHFSKPEDTGDITNVFSYDSTQFEVSQFKIHSGGCDVAVLNVTSYRDKLSAAAITPLELATPDDLGVGESLYWVGHPASGMSAGPGVTFKERLRQGSDLLATTQGEVSTTKKESLGYGHHHWPESETFLIVTTETIKTGNSGGPMMRERDGKVVGICTARNRQSVDSDGNIRGVPSRSLAVRSRHIVQAIEDGTDWDPLLHGPDSLAELRNSSGADVEVQLGNAIGQAECSGLQSWTFRQEAADAIDAITREGGVRITCVERNIGPGKQIEIDTDGLVQAFFQRVRAANIDLAEQLADQATRSSVWAVSIPDRDVDTDIFFLSRSGELLRQEKARSEGPSYVAVAESMRRGVLTPARSLRVVNSGEYATSVLIVLFIRITSSDL